MHAWHPWLTVCVQVCPSCHQKRTLLTTLHVADGVCCPVSNRQLVLTIPRRLQIHTHCDWRLLGKLSFCACTCLKVEAGRMLDYGDVTLGMVVAIQTHGKLFHWHSNIHVLLTYGAFVPQRRVSGVASVRYGETTGYLARSGFRAVSGRVNGRIRSRRVHVDLAALWPGTSTIWCFLQRSIRSASSV